MKKVMMTLVAVLTIATLTACGGSRDESVDSDTAQQQGSDAGDTSTYSVDVTPIDVFEYTVNGDNTLCLDRVRNPETTIIISDTYNINGTEYTVTEVADAFFNGSDAENIFFPETIKKIYDNTLAYLHAEHVNIYYAGTKEQWDTVFTEYKASSASEEWKAGNYEDAGAAAADKINSLFGHEYDPAQFTIHYDSDVLDVKK